MLEVMLELTRYKSSKAHWKLNDILWWCKQIEASTSMQSREKKNKLLFTQIYRLSDMSVTTIFVTSSQKQNNSVHQLWWKWNNNPSGQTACRLEPGQDDASEWKLFSLIGTDNCIRPEYPAHLWLQCSEHWIKNIQWLQCLVWLKGRTNASWLSGTILKHFLGSILHYLWMEQQCDVIADWKIGQDKEM